MHLRRSVGLVALAATSSSLLALAAPPATAQAVPSGLVFINEIHYDNVGTDVGETVEVAGPVGTDLTGWSVVLYNGNTATAAVTYGTPQTLSGPIPASGVVTLDYPANGLQNGPVDGLALVSPSGMEQFLSYGGVMTASNGPAAGATSTDIGVVESSGTPVGSSLQLTGTGSAYDDFTWTGPVAATPGALNAGQVLEPADPDAPAAPVATCPDEVVLPQGTTSAAPVAATDADSRITSIAVTSNAVDGIALADAVASDAVGAPGTADLVVSDQVAGGSYAVVVTFTSDSGQSTTCTVAVAVTPGDATPISTVQGGGAVSPLVGQEVLVEGVVVGDYQERGEFGGFYVQSLSPDGDALTSEGLRVFTYETAVKVGDLVRVVGTVSEFASSGLYSGSETQLAPVRSVEVLDEAQLLPEPTRVTLPFAQPVAGVDGQERYEGMLATLTNDDLVATDLYTLGRYGEVSLTTGEVLYIPTSAEQAAANDVDRITLDDGLSGQNLPTLPYTIGGDGITLPRAGDLVVDPVIGVLTFAFGEWRVVPAVGTEIDFARSEPRPEAPDEVGGDVQIASFNVLNYFVDFGGSNRGANDAEELQRQQDKLVAAITGLDADVVGLIEIANDDGDALDALIAALNAVQDPAERYTAVDAPVLNAPTSLGGTYGTDAIRQAIIYRQSVVRPAGPAPSDPALLNPADPLFPSEPVFDRPPAVQAFVPVGGQREFTVVVNHFKSKGSSNAQCGTPDPFGGNCDDLRERQSAALLDLVEALGAEDVALLGDFNSYESEQPIEVLEAAGWVSVVADQPREDRTSYSFDGEFGSLDYIFLSPSLAPAKTGAGIWQINSPEAVALDYNDYNQEQLYAPGPYASSDHDPVLVGLDLVPAPVVDAVRPGRPAAPGRPAEPGRPDGAGRPAQPGPPPFAGTPARRGLSER